VTFREDAFFRARYSHGDHIGVVLSSAQPEISIPASWHHLDFRNRHMLDTWFRDAVSSPGRFVYIAAFDKTTPDWLVEAPIAEMHGAGTTGERPPVGGIVGNQRGRYGTLLYDGSLYSSPPWGGAPDVVDDWAFRGPRSFHGHESPTYGRGGLWSHRRESPLGRGRLIVGENDRGTYGAGSTSPRESVGISLFHTVGDRDRLVDQIQTEISQLYNELWRKMGGDPSVLDQQLAMRDPIGWSKRHQAQEEIIKRSPLYPLYKDTFAPVYSEWKRFHDDQSSWVEWKTNWETYTGWRDRVADLHAHVVAEVRRIMPDDPIRTPSPSDAPTTIWEDTGGALKRGAGAIGGALGDVWKVAKVALYAGVAVGGVYVATKLVQTARGDHR
jgi:hypothetical protein